MVLIETKVLLPLEYQPNLTSHAVLILQYQISEPYISCRQVRLDQIVR